MSQWGTTGADETAAKPRPPKADDLLTAAAVVFLGVYAVPILWPGLDRGWIEGCHVASWLIWALFAVDVAVRFARASPKRSFARHNILEIASVVLPVLRPLRALRLISLLSMVNRRATTSLRGQVTTYVMGAASLLVVVAALAVLDAERGRGGQIQTFGAALWWAMETVTTVGYGDATPVTGEGRAIAAALMLAGIGVLGTVTATLASWMVERISEDAKGEALATQHQVERLESLVEELTKEIRGRRD